jgi:hypothetical protein
MASSFDAQSRKIDSCAYVSDKRLIAPDQGEHCEWREE